MSEDLSSQPWSINKDDYELHEVIVCNVTGDIHFDHAAFPGQCEASSPEDDCLFGWPEE